MELLQDIRTEALRANVPWPGEYKLLVTFVPFLSVLSLQAFEIKMATVQRPSQ